MELDEFGLTAKLDKMMRDLASGKGLGSPERSLSARPKFPRPWNSSVSAQSSLPTYDALRDPYCTYTKRKRFKQHYAKFKEQQMISEVLRGDHAALVSSRKDGRGRKVTRRGHYRKRRRGAGVSLPSIRRKNGRKGKRAGMGKASSRSKKEHKGRRRAKRRPRPEDSPEASPKSQTLHKEGNMYGMSALDNYEGWQRHSGSTMSKSVVQKYRSLEERDRAGKKARRKIREHTEVEERLRVREKVWQRRRKKDKAYQDVASMPVGRPVLEPLPPAGRRRDKRRGRDKKRGIRPDASGKPADNALPNRKGDVGHGGVSAMVLDGHDRRQDRPSGVEPSLFGGFDVDMDMMMSIHDAPCKTYTATIHQRQPNPRI